MSPADFRAALEELGLTQLEAAKVLSVSSEARINDWARGRRTVPPYIGAHLRTLLAFKAECEGAEDEALAEWASHAPRRWRRSSDPTTS